MKPITYNFINTNMRSITTVNNIKPFSSYAFSHHLQCFSIGVVYLFVMCMIYTWIDLLESHSFLCSPNGKLLGNNRSIKLHPYCHILHKLSSILVSITLLQSCFSILFFALFLRTIFAIFGVCLCIF